MKKQFLLPFFIFFWISLIFSSCSQENSTIPSQKKGTSPQKALQRLVEGNKRYVNNNSLHPNRNEERRQKILSKQFPYAIIVGCSDSRVAPEIIFDEGLGDLFVVRVAGNIVGTIELESIEYSALYLNSAMILVLGHENCGAVDAVIEKNTSNIKEIAKLIEPAVKQSQKDNKKCLLEHSIKTNALNMKNFLENSPNIKRLIQNKKIEVHAAYYNLKSGLVEILDDQKNTIE